MSGRSDEPPILVVERDLRVGTLVVERLTIDGHAAQLASEIEHARLLTRLRRPPLVVLGDLEHPHTAIELLLEIRQGDPLLADLPVIVMCSHARESDLERAFEAGADDFIARPASYQELRARLRAVLSRTGSEPRRRTIEVGPLKIDVRARTVSLHGQPVQLRRMEYELLLCLARDPQRVFTRHELLRGVW